MTATPPSVRAFAVLIGLGCGSLFAGPAVASPPADATDQVVVRFDQAATAGDRLDARRSVDAVASERLSVKQPRTYVMRLPQGDSAAQAVATLRRDPDVAFAEPDYLISLDVLPARPTNLGFTGGFTWGLYGLGATANLFSSAIPTNNFGSNAVAAWANGFTGSRSVYVGINDTGVQITHPGLVNNIWSNPSETGLDGDGQPRATNGIDDDANGFTDDAHGFNFHGNGSSGTVYSSPGADGHGTHVAGIIGAQNDHSPVLGVNWAVTMIPAKSLDATPGSYSYSSDAARAIDYLVALKAQKGLRLVAINASYGSTGNSRPLQAAIRGAGDAGILFVAAAGNGGADGVGDDTDTVPNYPSSGTCDVKADGSARGYDCIISVAATTSGGVKSVFSNYGATSVDLGAPGSNIWSTWPVDSNRELSGTSMAAPFVTGAIALCASRNASATPRAMRAALLASGAATPTLAGTTVSGKRLDIGAFLATNACTPDDLLAPIPAPGDAPAPLPPPVAAPAVSSPPVRLRASSPTKSGAPATAPSKTLQVSVGAGVGRASLLRASGLRVPAGAKVKISGTGVKVSKAGMVKATKRGTYRIKVSVTSKGKTTTSYVTLVVR